MANNQSWIRSHTCGDARRDDSGASVVLAGWVMNHRDLGGVIFIDLRDRYGITQVVFRPEENRELAERAARLRMESVVAVKGTVGLRPADMVRGDLATGEIEVVATDLELLNDCRELPFMIRDDNDASDETRLKYRYLDLRRPVMQKNILLRHRVSQTVRRYFDHQRFVEIETPMLMKSTPEGARDYLVPSRIHKGCFYALPQSPQTYKQLLMVAGFDRYFQIVKCFRDEDLRADRQPEFTQIDVEMSFIDEDGIIQVVEGLMAAVFREAAGIDLPVPFPRMGYDEALLRYGNDSPDIRYGMEIEPLNELVGRSGFKVFDDTVSGNGAVRGFTLEQCGPLSRKQVDDLTEYIRGFGAKGLVVIQMKEEGASSPILKFLQPGVAEALTDRFSMRPGDALFIVADRPAVTAAALGNLRRHLAAAFGRIPDGTFAPVWVLDFPLLDWDEAEQRYTAMHHPFTSPKPEDISRLATDPGSVRARAYDLVLNGSEVAGGSIRNYRRDVQQLLFSTLGIDAETAERKFGFLMRALEFGAPPHGGIAFGLDRLVTLIAGETSIREVIAFPKTTSAFSLMDESPSKVDEKQLDELGITILKTEE
ncbi:aspartate--tRNA ligase [bacterium]|nr:aspartate--tRNA ligase [bacterium]